MRLAFGFSPGKKGSRLFRSRSAYVASGPLYLQGLKGRMQMIVYAASQKDLRHHEQNSYFLAHPNLLESEYELNPTVQSSAVLRLVGSLGTFGTIALGIQSFQRYSVTVQIVVDRLRATLRERLVH